MCEVTYVEREIQTELSPLEQLGMIIYDNKNYILFFIYIFIMF